VMHSHNYTAAQAYKRSFGDARALAASWERRPDYFNFCRTVLLGCLSDLRHDVSFCARNARWKELLHAAAIRWHQRRGKLDGFRAGWKDYRLNQKPIGEEHIRPGFSLSSSVKTEEDSENKGETNRNAYENSRVEQSFSAALRGRI
jgi:hypothetical protein